LASVAKAFEQVNAATDRQMITEAMQMRRIRAGILMFQNPVRERHDCGHVIWLVS
jgi:hypothetical protein